MAKAKMGKTACATEKMMSTKGPVASMAGGTPVRSTAKKLVHTAKRKRGY